MSRDKQIEEMAKILVKNSYLCKGEYIRTTGKHNRDHCEDCDLRNACLNYDSATDLYNAGYRKASEVAREIFEEIERWLAGSKYSAVEIIWGVKRQIEELKKKYTEDEG